MAIEIPKYIEHANIQDDVIRYVWDDWNVEQAETPIDPDLLGRLERITMRANMAFTIATCEWIYFRLEILLENPLPLDYLEAAWTQVVDFRYGFIWWDPLHDDEWVGPDKGPVREAVAWVMSCVRAAQEYQPSAEISASISRLAEHVMPDPAPYRVWRDQVLDRMEKLYALDPEEMLGDVVPRESLDPEVPFLTEQTELLINRFLAGLDPSDNTFLKSAEALSQEGFEGTPYLFDLERDRKARLEW